MQIIWLKRDLRVQNHAPLRQALAQALQHGPVLPLYVHEPSLISRADFSAQHAGFIRETLDELAIELQAIGGALLELVGEVPAVLAQIHERIPVSRVLAHQETTTLAAFERDKAVAQWCRNAGVGLIELPQNAVKRGARYHSEGFQFSDHLTLACAAPPPLVCGDLLFAPHPLPPCSLQTIPRGTGTDKLLRARGGAKAANALLDTFLVPEKLLRYPTSISSPNTAVDGCSRMSPYLSFGVLSDQAVFERLVRAATDYTEEAQSPAEAEALKASVKFFTERLYWRSAYLQSMELKPETEMRNDLLSFDGVREAEFDAGWLEAWAQGSTGYPMIDAAMKMLSATGWINMRARGMVTSFAVNELWLPWRRVGLHLAREFLDYEPGIHYNQMQIHSGTSRLSGPLTYNAIKQAQDHDPKGTFVRKWLTALEGVPPEYLFEPWKMPASVQVACNCQIGHDYPAPIVALQAANDAAKQRVAALREGRPVPPLLYWKQRSKELALAGQKNLF